MELNRRHVLCGLGGLVVGTAATGLARVSHAQETPMQRFGQANGDFGWTPHKIDPKEAAAVAYDGYWYKGYGCGYGVFYSLIGLMAEKYGAPYNTYPFTTLETFKGGISDWATICGALAGGAQAFSLFWGRDERGPLVNELFRWYETAALPIYQPGDLAQGVKGEIPTSVSNSVLCHISLSKWSYQTKLEANSKNRNERCARVTADVAFKSAEILNAKIDAGKDWKGALGKQASVAACQECHNKGKSADYTKGVMDCTPCHSGSEHTGNKFKDHP